MASLRELQQSFAAAIFANDHQFAAHIRSAGGLRGEQRLSIYRNNTQANFTDALRITYPVVDRLVGDGFFRYAAVQYLAQHPSASGDLQEFGGSFPEFLETFEAAAQLPYLADVARLELAQEQVFYAAEGDFLDTVALSRVPQERYGELRFILNPASRLLSSTFPILRIWQVNQEGYHGDQSVDLNAGGVELLVIRQRNMDVEIQNLSAGDCALLRALRDGQDFATACEQAMTAQPDFDIPAGFRRHVAQGALVGFSL
ncbi:MAG: putative DNA-binding domain-containing protein [Gammaproteobacteria bacterium]|nr:putative DNA-binding domain-containing protein [Gammaproteobacteria bacterium]MCP5459429.1 putative DNA-binding domain-containing protein [Gammaproteobacteria bacterium]